MSSSKSNLSLSQILLPPDSLPSPWDWESLFGNTHPVEIEIGSGKGGFLIASSEAYPGKNFLGIEKSIKMTRYTAERLGKRSISNIRLVCANAQYILTRMVPDTSVSVIHIYFPDPWPKTRHQKRRLMSPDFLKILRKVLIPGGTIQFATDHQDYYEETKDLFSQSPHFQSLDPGQWIDTRPEECITNYEIKYRRESRPIYYSLYEYQIGTPPLGVG